MKSTSTSSVERAGSTKVLLIGGVVDHASVHKLYFAAAIRGCHLKSHPRKMQATGGVWVY